MSIDTNYIPQHPDWVPLSNPEETTVKKIEKETLEKETLESEINLVENIKKITFKDE